MSDWGQSQAGLRQAIVHVPPAGTLGRQAGAAESATSTTTVERVDIFRRPKIILGHHTLGALYDTPVWEL